MPREFLLPDPGEGIHEAEILEVHVSAGDEVKDGDPLFSVETDKAVVDIPASFDGVISEVRVDVGNMVEVGSVLLTFTDLGERTSTQDEADQAEAEPAEEEPAEEEPAEEEPAEEEPAEEEPAEEEPAEATAEPTAIDEEPSEEDDGDANGHKQRPVPASPATRSLAKSLDVDLHQVKGSGPDGRIEPADVQAAADQGEKPAGEKAAAAATPEDKVEWVELRGVRRATARNMATSWREIPHVSHHEVADITDLEQLRHKHASRIDENGGQLSITPFLVKAAATALREHPRFNASFDAENERIALNRRINIGVAVDTDDGLIVPVIQDVPRKSIAQIAREVRELAERVRDGDRSLQDLQGGTFTITNPGGIGGTAFNPIINHPEVAILGAARAREVPVLEKGDDDSTEIKARLHLPLVLAFDHRVNDGADAARFMNAIKELLEDPGHLVLHL